MISNNTFHKKYTDDQSMILAVLSRWRTEMMGLDGVEWQQHCDWMYGAWRVLSMSALDDDEFCDQINEIREDAMRERCKR